MKELNIHNRETNFPVIIKEQKKTTFIASLHPHNGHKVFEFNLTTGAIKEAQINETAAQFTGGKTSKVITQPGCIYTAALNIENAQKKFFKHLRNNVPL